MRTETKLRRGGRCSASNRFLISSFKPRRGSACRDDRKRKDGPITLTAIISVYIRNYRRSASRELRYFEIQRNLKMAIELAALAKIPKGRRHDHQRRLKQRDLQRWYKTLTAQISRIRSCDSFQELFEFLESVGQTTKGIGELAIYDTAQRIGAYLGLSPEVVYLHAGTRKGAKMMGFGRGRGFLRMEELPSAFARLRPHEVEDCLCIYAHEPARLRQIYRSGR